MEIKKHKILLALKSKSAIERLSGQLEEKGYVTITALDGPKAMEVAIRDVPALIIADIDLPLINGERLFQILRKNPHASKAPFIFLAEGRSEVQGFRIGIDMFVTQPYKWDELYGNIKQMFIAKDKRGILGDKAFQGKVSQVSLVDILQILHMNKKEGEVSVTSGEHTGLISIKEGQVYNALLGETEKEKALYKILSWKEGIFDFRPTTITDEPLISISTGNLLMEAMRQIDEFENMSSSFPAETSIMTTTMDISCPPEGLKPVVLEVLRLLKYYPKVKDLVENCTFPDYEAYKTIASLMEKNILTEVKQTDTAPSNDFISPTQAIKVKEKAIGRWADMLFVNFGKIFVASSSSAVTNEFIMHCKDMPNFLVDRRLATATKLNEHLFGDLGTLSIYGGMDIILFSVPVVGNINPLLSAFSNNVIGLVMLWDEEGEDSFQEMVAIKRDTLSKRRVPVLHIYCGKKMLDRLLVEKYRKLLNLKQDEHIFMLGSKKQDVFKIFQTFFNSVIKEEYIPGGTKSA